MAVHGGGGNKRGRRASFGSIRKLPSGRFQARYVGPDGRRVPRSDDVPDQRRRERIPGAASVRDHPMPSGCRPRPRPRSRPSRSRSSHSTGWPPAVEATNTSRLSARAGAFPDPAFGERPVVEISRSEVREWYAGLPSDAPTMRMHAYGLLRTILGSAVADEVIAVNPAYIRGAGNVERAKEPRPATVRGAGRHRGVGPRAVPRHGAARCLVCPPLRRAGRAAGQGHRPPQPGGAGTTGEQYGWTESTIIGTPKSRAGVRDVSIPPHLLPVIKAHIQDLAGAGGERLLFPAGDGVSTMNPSTLYKVYYPARSEAGRPDLRFHDLRHTGAVLAAQTGATLAELMARLGHSTPGAALRYQHAAEGRDRLHRHGAVAAGGSRRARR